MKKQTNLAKRRSGKRAISVILTAALAVTAFAGLGAVSAPVSAATENYGLVDSIQDGTILHCYDWKYTDIIDSLEDIAKAGFSSIQTSPVQPSVSTGPWYWLYQPLSFSVAENGDLGTAAELKELCERAEQYGIKVIVDVVANHLADNHENIQEDLKDAKYWHNLGFITDYTDRYQITNGDLGMKDLATEDEYVQQVVSNYIKDLKDMGVDGIRWDAAKHISLPSEGSAFWQKVTASGLYNYGEVLDSPVNGEGGNELMSEYANYLSVTDNGYSDNVTRAFYTGKAPKNAGNWASKGIASNKLVYWGESHDTYSNGENQGSNGYSQNVVDRGYAVVAARDGAAALYLSRPYATAKDSIRIGVKGSMHFTAPEVSAVNHFHNAMVGKKDAYLEDDNCAVVTRENGGAVLVCGKDSGNVSVRNVNGYVPAGTYYDEVSGNKFLVTETSITGVVGQTGIAVIYDSPYLSKVYADKPSDTEFKDTMNVNLGVIKATDAKYTVTVDGENRIYNSGSFIDGETVTIGAGVPADSKVYLTLTAVPVSDPDSQVTMTYTYKKLPERKVPTLNAGGVVLDNSKAGWSTVNVYVYDESGAETITNATWPGVAMTDCGDDYYSYELPEQFAECKHIMVIFNNGEGDQIPGAMQDGLTMTYTDQKLYNGTKWVDLGSTPEPEPEPEPEPVPEAKYNLGVMGSFNNWSEDIPMQYMDDYFATGIYVATIDNLEPGEYEFKVRADGKWDLSWGEYEPEYDRTQNSQTNCKATITEKGQRLVIMINTETVSDDAKNNPDSLVNSDEYTSDDAIEFFPVQSYVFIPDNSGRKYGVVGSFNGWGNDIELTDKYGVGIYYATIKNGLKPGETYEFKVRADGAWDMSWGKYEKDYDRTQNSQINCSFTVAADADSAELCVALCTFLMDPEALLNPDSIVFSPDFSTEDLVELWPVVYTVVNKYEPVEEPSQPSEDPSQPSEDPSQPSEQPSQTSETSKPIPDPGYVATADSTSAIAIVMVVLGSAAAAFVLISKKKREK